MALAPARPAPPALAGEIERTRLDNGLELCVVRNRQAPIVSSAIFYRVGARDETAGAGGTAHFLEHMMFKGSPGFGPGEIDRVTQTLGGTNNAFTSHDLTAYYFSFAADRWTAALEIESDRMRGLTLDPREVASERQVIVEEIAMYRDEPWDALELDVAAALWGDHPYGRPVLGTADELAGIGREELAAFHERWYRPDEAVLVVAGDVGSEVFARVEETFGAVPPRGVALRPLLAAPRDGAGRRRLERRHGEVPRLLLALPAPAPDEPDHGALRMLAAVLSLGRSSRLQRTLVEEAELCLAISAGLAENALGSSFTVAAEVLPGVDPLEIERRVEAELAELAARPVADEELDRARQVFLADWVFGQERIHQQGLAAGVALALFDLGQPDRLLRAALEAEPADLARVATRWLAGERGVVGLSLPE